MAIVGNATNDPLLAEFEQLEGDRGQWEDLWQQIAYLVHTLRDFTFKRAPGEKRNLRVYDSTAIQANERLASLLHGFLTNPAIKWFDLKMRTEELNDRDDVRAWLFAVREQLLNIFARQQNGFHTHAHELYMDLGAFGTAGMFVGDSTDGVRFETRPLPELHIKENHRGQVDSVFRKFSFTSRQARQFYGEKKLPPEVLKEIEKQPNKKRTFLHAVMPREDRKRGRYDAMNKPWASCHYLLDTKQKIMEGGFDDFPYLIPRWSKASGENYGRSPAMSALPDIEMLQAMSRTVIRAAQKVTDPPVMMPDDGFLNPLRTAPGAVNYYRASTRDRIETLDLSGRFDLGLEMMNQRREAINRAFFLDLANLREADRMTATEVLERRESRFRQMSPMLARLQAEFLSPLIERVFNILMRRELVPEPPAAVQGEEFDIEFVAPAALAQRTTEADNYLRWISMIAPVVEFDPISGRNIDVDAFIRRSAKLHNIPPALLVKKEQMEAIRTQMAQKEQMQAGIDQLREGGVAAEAIGDGAKAVQVLQEGEGGE